MSRAPAPVGGQRGQDHGGLRPVTGTPVCGPQLGSLACPARFDRRRAPDHAHLDHCGLLPKLVKDGFHGRIYCTAATAEIARIILMDSARIQVEDAEFKLKRHKKERRAGPYPVQPLYTTEDVEACMPLFSPVPYRETFSLGQGLSARLCEAGHVLGSAIVKVTARWMARPAASSFPETSQAQPAPSSEIRRGRGGGLRPDRSPPMETGSRGDQGPQAADRRSDQRQPSGRGEHHRPQLRPGEVPGDPLLHQRAACGGRHPPPVCLSGQPHGLGYLDVFRSTGISSTKR